MKNYACQKNVIWMKVPRVKRSAPGLKQNDQERNALWKIKKNKYGFIVIG